MLCSHVVFVFNTDWQSYYSSFLIMSRQMELNIFANAEKKTLQLSNRRKTKKLSVFVTSFNYQNSVATASTFNFLHISCIYSWILVCLIVSNKPNEKHKITLLIRIHLKTRGTSFLLCIFNTFTVKRHFSESLLRAFCFI